MIPEHTWGMDEKTFLKENENYIRPLFEAARSKENFRMMELSWAEQLSGKWEYTDSNGDVAVIPDRFRVSDREDEQTIDSGLVVIGPDGSEFVWVPTTQTVLAVRNFGSYVSWGANPAAYFDETELPLYQEMVESIAEYGGFYMGRYEASYGSGDDLSKLRTRQQAR